MNYRDYTFVLDCSVTIAWCFNDEKNRYAESMLSQLEEEKALVPSLWAYEVCNVLTIAQRCQRITSTQSTIIKEELNQLPIFVNAEDPTIYWSSIAEIASATGLTAYDAAYLDLCIRKDLPIATLDKQLKKAASKYDIELYH